MKEASWSSLTASLQSGECVLVLGPDIPATPIASAGSKDESVRDAFCRDLVRQLEEAGQKVGELVLFAVAQQYDDSPAVNDVNLRNIAAAFFRNSGHREWPYFLPVAGLLGGLLWMFGRRKLREAREMWRRLRSGKSALSV